MLMLFMLLIWLTQEGHNLLQLLSQGQAVLLLHLLIHELCESRFDRVLIPALEKDDVPLGVRSKPVSFPAPVTQYGFS